MITIKSPREIELLRIAGEITGGTLKYLKPFIKPGITTKQLDKLAYDYITQRGATPSFKGYDGFPGTICASINEEVVHGIPSNRKLKEGDIITIDMVIGYKGYQADAAWTYAVGEISEEKGDLEYRKAQLKRLQEEVVDIGWENVQKAVKTLMLYNSIDKQILVHCDGGNHRSRLVVEAFYFAKFGTHLIDEYKGYENHLIYDCSAGYLPPLNVVEDVLKQLVNS